MDGSFRAADEDRRLGGRKRQLSPIGKSVSVSFRVRVVRACVRAKLCGRVREVLSDAGAADGKMYSGSGLSLFKFECNLGGFYGKSSDLVAMLVGFMAHVQILSLLRWVSLIL